MTDYNWSGEPFSLSRGLSARIRDEFRKIEEAVNSKANIESPALTGTPTAPTPALGDATNTVATTEFVDQSALSLFGELNALIQGGLFFKGDWSDLSGPLDPPATVYHLGRLWLLQTSLSDITLSEPGGGNPDWAEASPSSRADLHAAIISF